MGAKFDELSGSEMTAFLREVPGLTMTFLLDYCALQVAVLLLVYFWFSLV